MSTETFDVTNPLKPWILKDPNAVLDYTWDWTDWLAQISDTISAYLVFSVDPDVTVASTNQISGLVTAFLSGGTIGETHQVTCRITTVGGRIDDRSIYLRIKQR